MPASKDITNREFRKLKALYKTEKRDRKGNVMWHCVCECGAEVDVSYNALVHSGIQSCGCQKRAHTQGLRDTLIHKDGTSIDMLRSKKISSSNTTGVRGVYLIKGKYVAKITLQQKVYRLGTYDNIAEAVAARQAAEKNLFGTIVEAYDRWTAKATENPHWGEENPFEIKVIGEGANITAVVSPA